MSASLPDPLVDPQALGILISERDDIAQELGYWLERWAAATAGLRAAGLKIEIPQPIEDRARAVLALVRADWAAKEAAATAARDALK